MNNNKSQNKDSNIDRKDNEFDCNNRWEPPKKDGLTYDDWKEKRKELFEDMHRVEEKSLDSTKQTLSLIDESERIGVKTGNELIRQKETLNRVEDKLVTINGHLDESQRHIKSMKSVFNSFKGYFSKKSNQTSVKSCENDLNEVKNSYEYNPDVSQRINNDSNGNGNALNGKLDANDSSHSPEFSQNETINYWHKSNQMNDKIEENLNNIDLGVERLKQLSLNLGHELDSQNSLVDRITKESESAELRIKQQNTQMRQILNKK